MKRIVSMMLTLCMLLTCISMPATNVNADEVSASSLKAYMKETAGEVNASFKAKGIALETEIRDDNQILVYVNDRTLSMTGLVDSVSDMKALFSYSGISSVVVKWNNGNNKKELKGLSASQIGETFMSVYGLTTYDIIVDGYEVYKLSEKDPVTISLGLTTGEQVNYSIKFTCLETYLKEAAVDANKLLTNNKVPMTMSVDNEAMKINVTITDASYKAVMLALSGDSKDFLSTMFSYKAISDVEMNGEKAANLGGTTLATLFIKKLFPGAIVDGSYDFGELSKITFGDLAGKKLTVKITLYSGQVTSYEMNFTVKQETKPEQPSTPTTPSTPSTPTVKYDGKIRNLKVTKTTKSIKLTWKAPTKGATGYKIVQTAKNKKTITKNWTKKTLSFTFNSLASGTVYTYKITPYSTINGKKVYGTTTTIKGITNPKKVTLSKVSSGKKALKASWRKVTATGYEMQVSTSSKFTKKTTKILKTNKVNVTAKNLKAKKKYYVRVRAYTKSGKTVSYSSWSNKKTVKTKK